MILDRVRNGMNVVPKRGVDNSSIIRLLEQFDIHVTVLTGATISSHVTREQLDRMKRENYASLCDQLELLATIVPKTSKYNEEDFNQPL